MGTQTQSMTPISQIDNRSGSNARNMLVDRLRGEYEDMPGLSLTLEQAARLFGLGRAATEVVLDRLLREGFLRRTEGGQFIRRLSRP